MAVPYTEANSSTARAEIIRILRGFGCEAIGFMDNFDQQSVTLAFRHRGRAVELHASAKGWAALYLKKNPWSRYRRISPTEYEHRALTQGMKAVNSILRDWIKGQVTAVECGILSFEAVFMPHMLTNDGRPLIERLEEKGMLPAPDDEGDAA